MANWISSKLKAAETILQQIDQQAAESLGKTEKSGSDELKLDTSTKSSGVVSLKDQLKRKTQNNNDYQGKLDSDSNVNSVHSNNSYVNTQSREKEIASSPNSSPTLKPKATLTDSDWTELLGTPNQGTSPSGKRNNVVSTVRGLRKDGKRPGSSVLEAKRNQKSSSNAVKYVRRSDIALGTKLIGKPSDSEESSSSGRPSSVDMQNDGKKSEGLTLDKVSGTNLSAERKDEMVEENGGSNSKDLLLDGRSLSLSKNHSLEKLAGMGKVARASDGKTEVADACNKLRSSVKEKTKSNVAVSMAVANDLKRSSSFTSNGSSDSDTGSGSTSDSESEREREERRRRREKLLAERAAAKAGEAIKERENIVARLEGEKQSLEKILEERAKQQAQEASELQTTTMEMMEAVELEKQKHNNTRMEALQRLAKLETANADLAKSLATMQKKLELEIDQVAELRQQIELKEAAHEELGRRISSTHQRGTYLNLFTGSKGVEFECKILEAEYSLVTDKIGQSQQKAKELEANIELTRKEMEEPTEVEIELKRRLGQLTDHLIQKQAQVEALSSEKATLLFRIETVSRMLEESKSNINGASSGDLESGTWKLSDSKLKPLLQDKIRSGKKQLGSLLLQLDAIFSAGVVFLRRNPAAKMWSLVYLFCLHFWVIYILMSHSRVSNEAKSGAVISLENINNTAGI
ncbi:hypothetical protein SLA2020_361120 [Shorea laevis]